VKVIVTLDFTSPSPLTPEGFSKWLQVNLSEHLEAEHKWDDETCPPLSDIEVELSPANSELYPTPKARTRARKESIPNGK
jgi:hypothetical protein